MPCSKRRLSVFSHGRNGGGVSEGIRTSAGQNVSQFRQRKISLVYLHWNHRSAEADDKVQGFQERFMDRWSRQDPNCMKAKRQRCQQRDQNECWVELVLNPIQERFLWFVCIGHTGEQRQIINFKAFRNASWTGGAPISNPHEGNPPHTTS